MYSYDTLSEALKDLEQRGYKYDFNLHDACLECKELHKKFDPETFKAVEVYRFEGMTSTDDESVIYAIETSGGIKGVLVGAYGTYADSDDVLEKLEIKRR